MDYKVGFLNQAQVTLYECELKGQMSDGAWENARPFKHWKLPCEATAFVADGFEQLGPNFVPLRSYDFTRKDLVDNLSDRMIGFVKYYSLFLHLDPSFSEHWTTDSMHSPVILQELFRCVGIETDPTGYWHRKLQRIMLLHGVSSQEELLSIAEKVQAVSYSLKDLRRDLRYMKRCMLCFPQGAHAGAKESPARVFRKYHEEQAK